MSSNREDLLEKVTGTTYRSYRLCSDHFEDKMFTNQLRNKLNSNAVPTIFPSLEGGSKQQFLDDGHENLPPTKIHILSDILVAPGKYI